MNRLRDQIEHSKFNDKIFLVGNFENRITVYSQQIRAINLISSLFKTNILNERSKLGIIGAGAAGLTAAIAAASYSVKKIDIYERNSEILSIWRDCKSRWLHPNLFSWPLDGWDVKRTDLPFLNWQAAQANEVADQIIYEWNTLIDYFKSNGIKINVHLNKKILINEDSQIFYDAIPKGKNYDAILICVGFGVDGNLNDINTCYWGDDNLEKKRGEDEYSLFISGNGDGGISDLLRSRMKSVKIDVIENWLKSNEIIGKLDKIKKIEMDADKVYQTTAPRERLTKTNQFLDKQYERLKTPSLKKIFKDHNVLRIDTLVHFHRKNKEIYNYHSFPLNRFLLSRLLYLKDSRIKYYEGEISDLETLKKKGKYTGEKIVVKVSKYGKVSVDEFITRHGAKSPLEEDGLKWIYDSKEVQEIKSKNQLDQTIRYRLWENSDFDKHYDILIKLKQNSLKIAIGIIKHKTKNRFIFTKRKKSKEEVEWGFVTKSLKPNYDTRTALALECYEEIGIECEVLELIGYRHHPRNQKYAEYWYCIHKGNKEPFVKDSNELEEVHWMTPDQILKLAPNIFEPIKKYFNV